MSSMAHSSVACSRSCTRWLRLSPSQRFSSKPLGWFMVAQHRGGRAGGAPREVPLRNFRSCLERLVVSVLLSAEWDQLPAGWLTRVDGEDSPGGPSTGLAASHLQGPET